MGCGVREASLADVMNQNPISHRVSSLGRLLLPAWVFLTATGLEAGSAVARRPAPLHEVLQSQGWHPFEEWRSLREQAESLMSWGLVERALKLQQQAAVLLEKQKGSQHRETLRNRADVAMNLIRLGKPEGEPQLREVFAAQQKLLPVNHPDLLMTRHLLANVTIARWDLATAEKELKEVVSLRARVLGPGHPDTLATRENLVFVLTNLRKNEEAEQQLKLVLAADVLNHGEGALQTCATRDRLGQCLQLQGKHDQALEEFRAVLEVLKKQYGPKHPLTFGTQHRMAMVLFNQGKHTQAERDFRALADGMAVLAGPDDGETLRYRKEVAGCLTVRGKLAEAEKELRETLDVCLRTQGEASLQLQEIRHDLAYVLVRLRRLDEAEKLLQASLDQRRKVQGPEHVATMESWRALAACLAERGDLAGAEKELLQLIQTQERVQGTNHIDTWNNRIYLAELLRKSAKFKEALEIFGGALKYERTTLGPSHPDTLKTLNNVALTLLALGRSDEALVMQSQVVRERARVLGFNHPETLRSRVNLAAHQASVGRLQESLQQYGDVLQIAPQTLGAAHEVTLVAISGFTRTLSQDRRPAEAERVLREGLKILASLGPTHPEVLRLKTDLGLSLVQQGRAAEAEGIVEEFRRYLNSKEGVGAGDALSMWILIGWVDIAKGGQQEAPKIAAAGIRLAEEQGLAPDNFITLRMKLFLAVALRFAGRHDEALQIASAVESLLPVAYVDDAPILTVPQTLRREGSLALPPLLHALHFSQPRVVDLGFGLAPPEKENGGGRQETAPASDNGEALALSEAGRHQAAFEMYEEQLAKASQGQDGAKKAAIHLGMARESLLLEKEADAREHLKMVAQELKHLGLTECGFVAQFLQTFSEQRSRRSDFKLPVLLARLQAEEAAAAVGEGHPVSISANLVLADLLMGARLPETLEVSTKQSAVFEKHLGAEHQVTLRMKLTLLRWHLFKQEFHDVHSLAYALDGPVTKVYGVGSNENVLVKASVAEAMEAQGLRSMAIAETKMVLADMESARGADSPQTVVIRHRLALMLGRAGRMAESIELHQQNLKLLSKPETASDPLVVEVRLNLAWALVAAGNLAEAGEQGMLALQGSRTVFGADHELTKSAENLLAEIKRLSGGK